MPRILHIGVGNFHRAHQAEYVAKANGNWRITGVVMGNTALFDAMSNGRGYSLWVRGPNGISQTKIAVHDRMILARDTPQDVIDAFVDPDVHIVTLTITEKGYCLDPATGALDLTNPAIVADLNGTSNSAVGLLARGLAKRAKAKLPALTIMSCDNLSGNGEKLDGAVRAFAKYADLDLDAATCFPDTMVDRITPATADATAPVITEDFSEWVIKDDFAGFRPNWEDVGAEFTLDVVPYEMRKLRLLNAAHSFLAYAGQLAGHTYVHEAMADKELKGAVERLWDEAQDTLPDAVLSSTSAYRAALIDRFAVAEMCHELTQIGADGSLKLRERIVPLIQERTTSPQAGQALAAWIAFVLHKDQSDDPLIDPNAKTISCIIASSTDVTETAAHLSKLVGVSDATDEWLARLAQQVDGFLNKASA